jgi:hypothetical protein
MVSTKMDMQYFGHDKGFEKDEGGGGHAPGLESKLGAPKSGAGQTEPVMEPPNPPAPTSFYRKDQTKNYSTGKPTEVF